MTIEIEPTTQHAFRDKNTISCAESWAWAGKLLPCRDAKVRYQDYRRQSKTKRRVEKPKLRCAAWTTACVSAARRFIFWIYLSTCLFLREKHLTFNWSCGRRKYDEIRWKLANTILPDDRLWRLGSLWATYVGWRSCRREELTTQPRSYVHWIDGSQYRPTRNPCEKKSARSIERSNGLWSRDICDRKVQLGHSCVPKSWLSSFYLLSNQGSA